MKTFDVGFYFRITPLKKFLAGRFVISETLAERCPDPDTVKPLMEAFHSSKFGAVDAEQRALNRHALEHGGGEVIGRYTHENGEKIVFIMLPDQGTTTLMLAEEYEAPAP